MKSKVSRRVLLAAAAALLIGTVSVRADNLTVGILAGNGVTNFSNGNVDPAPLTLIDIDHPAPAAGNLTSATLLWSANSSPCSSSFKVKFFRPGGSHSRYTFVAQRGPFDSQAGLLTVPLDPPVAVQAGDVMAVVQLGPTTCGGVYLTPDAVGFHTLELDGDDTDPITDCDPATALLSLTVSAQASGTAAETLGGIVPGVGSIHGAAGSNFKTAMQLTNAGSDAIQGHLVFHPMGQSASASDPSLAYSIPARGTLSFDDAVAALGASGLGSLDVMTSASYPPVVSTRVFNDGGAAGTAGFTEPMVRLDDTAVLQYGLGQQNSTFAAPSDPVRFRFNVGVRTLSAGASILAVVNDAAGLQRRVVTRSYGPNLFVQAGGSDFLNGYVLSANDSVDVVVTAGSAIVYAVSVDNVTNDTSFQLGDRRR